MNTVKDNSKRTFLIVGIVALLLLLLGSVIYTYREVINKETIKTKATQYTDKAKTKASQYKDKAKSLAANCTDKAKSMGVAIKSKFQKFAGKAQSTPIAAPNTTPTVAPEIMNIFKNDLKNEEEVN